MWQTEMSAENRAALLPGSKGTAWCRFARTAADLTFRVIARRPPPAKAENPAKLDQTRAPDRSFLP
jgi:hypothetical protein